MIHSAANQIMTVGLIKKPRGSSGSITERFRESPIRAILDYTSEIRESELR